MRNKNVKVIDKQFKSYCNDEDVLKNFYWENISTDRNCWDDKFSINIGDYDAEFINEFTLDHFETYDINYEKISGLGYKKNSFEWTDEKTEILDRYMYDKTQGLFETKYAKDVEDKLNKIHQEQLKELFDDDLRCLSFDIALRKILRSKIYNFGLGLKLNMRDAGII